MEEYIPVTNDPSKDLRLDSIDIRGPFVTELQNLAKAIDDGSIQQVVLNATYIGTSNSATRLDVSYQNDPTVDTLEKTTATFMDPDHLDVFMAGVRDMHQQIKPQLTSDGVTGEMILCLGDESDKLGLMWNINKAGESK